MKRVRPVGSLSTCLLVVASAASCSPRPEGAEYYWDLGSARRIYDVTTIAAFIGTVNGSAIVRPDGTLSVDGKTYDKFVTTFEGLPGPESHVDYYRLAEDGIYLRASASAGAEETLLIPLPPEVGRKWTMVQDGTELTLEIAALEDIDTPTKTYRRCIKIVGEGRSSSGTGSIVSYYAPDVGLIRMSVTGEGSTSHFKLRE